MRLKARLTSASIKQMADDLMGFKTDLQDKLRMFRERLAEKGIKVAMSNVNQEFGQYILFEKIDTDNASVIVARETSQILKEWLYYGENIQAYISPLLMSEFGSGSHAVNWVDSQGNTSSVLSDGTPIGRGSFPDQRNAFKDSWRYMDLSYN